MTDKEFKTKLGKLVNCDALEFLKTLESDAIDLIITDPPYLYQEVKISKLDKKKKSGLDHSFKSKYNAIISNNLHDSLDIKSYCDEFLRISKTKFFAIFMNRKQINEYSNWVKANNMDLDFILWHKTNPMPGNNFIFQDKEFCMLIYKTGKYKIPNYDMTYDGRKTIFSFPVGKKQTNHPTEKPLPLIKKIIKKFSRANDLVLDPFMGSGTTAYACEQLNRRWLGTELSEEWFTVAKQRLSKVQMELQIEEKPKTKESNLNKDKKKERKQIEWIIKL